MADSGVEGTKRRNDYYLKPRRSVNMWVIYIKRTGDKVYFPRSDHRGNITAYRSKSKADVDLHEAREYLGKAYLQKVGPIS